MHGLLSEQKFSNEEEATKWLDDYSASKPPSFYREGNHKLPGKWQKVIDNNGGYFEEQTCSVCLKYKFEFCRF